MAEILSEELLDLICYGLQTDECVAHCRPYCSQCITIANNLTRGGIIMAPWHIGDIVYYINPRTRTIETDTVIRLTITKSGCNPILEKHTTGFWRDLKWFRSEEAAQDYLTKH